VIWSLRATGFTTLHVVNGALLIGATGVLTLRAWLLTAPGASRRAASLELTTP
jgi:hypothetical protein